MQQGIAEGERIISGVRQLNVALQKWILSLPLPQSTFGHFYICSRVAPRPQSKCKDALGVLNGVTKFNGGF